MGNYGRVNADVRTAFYAEQTAMFVDSTAVLRGAMDTVDGKFEIGTAYLPRPTKQPLTPRNHHRWWIAVDHQRQAGRTGLRLGIHQIPGFT